MKLGGWPGEPDPGIERFTKSGRKKVINGELILIG